MWLVGGLGTAVIIMLVVTLVLVVRLSKAKKIIAVETTKDHFADVAKEDIQHIFNDAFRQELRNRGLLHFEEVINENAMFLQQDLRLTASQVNDYMKQEIKKNLANEFATYEQSINDAKKLAVESINQTQVALEQQREVLTKQLEEQFQASKAQLIARFEENMADIVNHYIMGAIGDQIDLNDQLEYIIGDLQANKKAIVEDISHGA